jgi:hypothetical protein
MKTTVKEAVASIEQGSFTRDRCRSEPDSGSAQIPDEIICDPVVQPAVQVADAQEDCDETHNDTTSESTSGVLMATNMTEICLSQK